MISIRGQSGFPQFINRWPEDFFKERRSGKHTSDLWLLQGEYAQQVPLFPLYWISVKKISNFSLYLVRCFVTGGEPAFTPSHSRVMEAVLIRLCNKHLSQHKATGASPYASKWKVVVEKYNELRFTVLHSHLSEQTGLQLLPINVSTLTKW